jgi:hypothetical protein
MPNKNAEQDEKCLNQGSQISVQGSYQHEIDISWTDVD